jgi:hypothetical protein
MEKIGEIEEATRLYRLCRELSTMIDFSSLPKDKRAEVNNLVKIMVEMRGKP